MEAEWRLGSRAIDVPSSMSACTPLFEAARHGRVRAIEALVRLGSKAIDTPNSSGKTPVQVAVQCRQLECARVLRALGAKIDVEVETAPVLVSPLDEDEAAEVRYRVFFARALLDRLLFAP